jgi:YD repeat-containing protein
MSLSDNPAFAPPEGSASIVSITDRLVEVDTGGPCSAVHFLGETALFVGEEESAILAAPDGSTRRVGLHGGGILCATSDGKRVLTGGDDGRVVAVDAAGGTQELATDPKRRWIDNVALHSDGTVAWSASKTAFVRSAKGEVKSFDAPSTVGGLAFAPKGVRLAIAHYNGVTLWFPNMAAQPERLEWAGSHLGVMFSPDNKFVITSMHEAAMHGWRLADQRHMRMSGYPARVRSMSWTAGGKGLATSGADTVIIWPFQSKDGPMGKQPAMLAPLKSRVTAVACHPKQEILAAGYLDGTILLVRLHDGAEILARRNTGGQVDALAWDPGGRRIAFTAQDGAGFLAL